MQKNPIKIFQNSKNNLKSYKPFEDDVTIYKDSIQNLQGTFSNFLCQRCIDHNLLFGCKLTVTKNTL